ncbi:class E sortase [Candidatus Saccharibacteria bacterium]|nr:class E sortase [Candidatus Saccharibacteria bacterium]
MESNTGGLSSAEKQRQAAAELARRKVLNTYESEEVKEAADFIRKSEKEERKGASSGVLGATSTPVLRQVTSEDWKKYHSAWQEYYQKYYSQYYMNAAKEYVAKEQVKKLREEQAVNEAKKLVPDFDTKIENGDRKSFKERIQEKAVKNAKNASRRRWLMPILSGVSVVLIILFLQYNRLIFAPIAAYVSPGEQPSTSISEVDPTVTLTKVSGENKLLIPKLNIDVPINFEVEVDDVMEAMNNGVAHYRINGASAYPGEIGNFVITGHSAGDIYSSNPYKFIFSGLERLEPGDLIYVHYNGTRYTYKMTKNEIIEPTEVSKLIFETDKPMLTLITCWPLGTSRYRLLVTAEQISPSYNGAQVANDDGIAVFEAEMPKNEDTFFEKIWAWLTGR